MSTPISYCHFVEAVDNQQAFDALYDALKRNLKSGRFTLSPCGHSPPCRQLSDEEINSLASRLDFLNVTSVKE
jgi:hypothetical protein